MPARPLEGWIGFRPFGGSLRYVASSSCGWSRQQFQPTCAVSVGRGHRSNRRSTSAADVSLARRLPSAARASSTSAIASPSEPSHGSSFSCFPQWCRSGEESWSRLRFTGLAETTLRTGGRSAARTTRSANRAARRDATSSSSHSSPTTLEGRPTAALASAGMPSEEGRRDRSTHVSLPGRSLPGGRQRVAARL
jgi:hypothetical protein